MTHESALQWTIAVVNRSEPSASYADMDDAALVTAAVAGARGALDVIVERHRRVAVTRRWLHSACVGANRSRQLAAKR